MSQQAINRIPPHERSGKTVQDNSWMDAVERFVATSISTHSGPFANDAAAAAGGIPIGGFYYDGSTPAVVHIRLV